MWWEQTCRHDQLCEAAIILANERLLRCCPFDFRMGHRECPHLASILLHVRLSGASQGIVRGRHQVRELTYQLSFKRLIELSRRGIRVLQGSTPRSNLRLFGIWVLVGLFLGVGFPLLYQQMIAAGFDPFAVVLLAIFLVIAILVASFILSNRNIFRRLWEGADVDQRYRVTQDSGGLRFATEEDEYYLKWHGITRMWLERDGVVVARGPMLLWVADTAFVDAAERLAFIHEIFARMSEKAQLRSAHHLQTVLADRNG